MSSIVFSRTAAETAFLNTREVKRLIAEKKLVKGFPIVDSNKPQHIEELTGNIHRTIKAYPGGFDFIVNIINYAWNTGRPEAFFRRVNKDWWRSRVFEQTWREYFSQCANSQIRRNHAQMIMKDLETGIILVRQGNDKHGYYIDEAAPFRFMAKRTYEDGTGYRDIFLLDAVWGSLITMDCKKTGGDGFGEMPPTLYPLLTTPIIKGSVLKSHNPVYKLNLLGIMKNTHKKKSIALPRQEFIETVIPEYLDRNGNLEVKADAVRENIENTMKGALNKIPQGMLVKNYYLGNPGGNTIIHFRIEDNDK
jgi:hypothetical protein